MINERDILGAQLIRRNDEIGLLHEKLKIQHSTLTRGEEQYSARVHDVQVLRLKIRDMQREVAVASGGAQLSDDLRRDLLQCRRDLLEEKAKCDLRVLKLRCLPRDSSPSHDAVGGFVSDSEHVSHRQARTRPRPGARRGRRGPRGHPDGEEHGRRGPRLRRAARGPGAGRVDGGAIPQGALAAS